MKVQAINTNTNFKGLFTDKSTQNNRNWRMEYQPYSWESNNTGKMANQADYNVYDKMLPDNEKIYKDLWGKKSCKDILGTEFYYEYQNGAMRRTITEMPSMNREDSLRVLDKKLGTFLDEKQELRKTLEHNYNFRFNKAEQASKEYDSLAKQHNLGYFDRAYTRPEYASKMNDQKRLLKQEFDGMYQNSRNYIKLMGSMDAVRETKENGLKEIKQLEELRKSGKLIDISRRDIVNPNEALKQALADIRAAAGKFVCLPHKLISMEEILKVVNPKNIAKGYDNEILQYVEKLIKRTV